MTGKFIDAHVHLVPAELLGTQNKRFGAEYLPYGYQRIPGGFGFHIMPPFIHDSQFTADTLVNMMDVYGVEKAVIQQSIISEQNEVVAQAVEKYPDRLAGAMILEPAEDWKEQLIYWKSRGLTVIKFEMRAFSMAYPEVGYDHPWMEECMSLAEQQKLTVVFDPAPVNFPVYQPEKLEELVRRHPDLHVVICHMAYPVPLETEEDRMRWQQMLKVAELPNCWMDLSAMPDFFDEEGWPYPTAGKLLKEVKQKLGPEKFLWGTDLPETLCKATYPQMQKMFSVSGAMTEEELDMLYYQNAKAAYRL